MGYHLPLILLLTTLFSGICFVFYRLIPKPMLTCLQSQFSFRVLSFFKDFFWVLLAVLIVRGFVATMYHVPTCSLEPTVIPGDVLIASKYSYGLHMPAWPERVLPTGKPKRGDIVIFYDPVHPKINLIKRLIGLPGDNISYINKVLYINGKKMKQTFIKQGTDLVSNHKMPVQIYRENLEGVQHEISTTVSKPTDNFYHLVVPKGNYFVMGDNRDYSDDSRYWGFVPSHRFFAKAHYILLNWHHMKRIGTKV